MFGFFCIYIMEIFLGPVKTHTGFEDADFSLVVNLTEELPSLVL